MTGMCLWGMTSCGSAPKPNPPMVDLLIQDMVDNMRLQNQIANQTVQQNLNR